MSLPQVWDKKVSRSAMGRSINSANQRSSDSDDITKVERSALKIDGGLRRTRQQRLRNCRGKITGHAPVCRLISIFWHWGIRVINGNWFEVPRIESGLRMSWYPSNFGSL
jgi:hypothetical protein